MKAMLLAAGRGERMRPLSDLPPKPLLEVGGKALIVWHIESLVRVGITELVINLAHLGIQVEQALSDGSRFGAKIRYSDEGTALETAGGIAFAQHLLSEQPFAVINSDIWCDYDYSNLKRHASALDARGVMAHLVLVDNPPQHPGGDFGLENGRVSETPPKLTFSGIGVYRPELFMHIPRGSKVPLAPLLRDQIAANKVSGEHYQGSWADIGTPQRLTELDRQVCALQKSARSLHNGL